MSDHYYDKDAIKNLGQLKRLKKELYESFVEFDGKVFAEGSLSAKTKELIAIACAHITRCPYCIDAHVRRAANAGATDEEIAEAVFVATAMSAGASIAHSSIAMASLEKSGQGE